MGPFKPEAIGVPRLDAMGHMMMYLFETKTVRPIGDVALLTLESHPVSFSDGLFASLEQPHQSAQLAKFS